MIVKEATPDMALNPLYVPNTVPTVPPSGPHSDQSDPWLVPKSTNFPKNFVVQKGVVYGFSGTTPNEVWNFLANGLTRLEPLHNNYFGSNIPMMRMPAFWSDCMTAEQFHTGFCGLTAKKISLDGWKNRHDLPWDQPFRYRDLECEATPTGPAGQQVFMHYVIWGLKHLLAETDYYRDFLVWDDQHRSWRLPFAFLPATDISPPVFFSLTWRKSDQGWKTSATPPYANLIRDVRNRRPDNEVLHIQLHASDLAMLPFHTRLLWLIPLPAEWSWLPAWCPGVHPAAYQDSDIWKKHQNEGTQSSSSTVPVASSMPMSSTSARSISSARPTPSCAPALTPVAEQEIEPEDTHPTPAMQQSHDVLPPQAFPYVTHTVDSDRDDVQVIARTPFGNTLVQQVCHGLSDTEAHEAVINKNWFRQVADAEAPRLQSKMGVSSRLHMTIPQWVSQKLQGEAALWSNKKDNGPGQASSSHSSTTSHDELQYPLHAVLQPSMQNLEAFLEDEKKEMEQAAAQHLLTMSQSRPSPESDSSSYDQERHRQDEEHDKLVEEQEENEEDFDDYWRSHYEELY